MSKILTYLEASNKLLVPRFFKSHLRRIPLAALCVGLALNLYYLNDARGMNFEDDSSDETGKRVGYVVQNQSVDAANNNSYAYGYLMGMYHAMQAAIWGARAQEASAPSHEEIRLALPWARNIQEGELNAMSLRDKDVRQLTISIPDYPYLNSLILRSNCIKDAGAIELSKFNTLTSLDLSNNEVGDQGARALAQSHHLKILSLQYNAVTDAGAMAFANVKNLERLNLKSNQISAASARGLMNNPYIKVLTLDSHFLPIYNRLQSIAHPL